MQIELPSAAADSDLTIRSVRARIVKAPLRFALGTSADVVRAAPVVLVDLSTEEGVVGRAYAFAYTDAGAAAVAALVTEAGDLVRGTPAAPAPVGERLARRYRLLGVAGAVRMALSTLDAALWDAQAIARDAPLCDLLGTTRRTIPAYDSRGLGLMAPDRLADEAARLMEDRRLRALKLRLGHPRLADDLAAVEAVLDGLPDDVGLMVDYNQALAPEEALRRCRALDGYGLLWIEEPMRHDDYPGQARLAAEIRTPLQIGENFNGPEAMAEALSRDAFDYAMPDVARIGGVTGWLRAAGLAAARGVPISSHLHPEISLSLLAASPTAHWLEYVDWVEAFLAEPLPIVDGAATPPARPGTGMDWDEGKIARLMAV